MITTTEKFTSICKYETTEIQIEIVKTYNSILCELLTYNCDEGVENELRERFHSPFNKNTNMKNIVMSNICWRQFFMMLILTVPFNIMFQSIITDFFKVNVIITFIILHIVFAAFSFFIFSGYHPFNPQIFNFQAKRLEFIHSEKLNFHFSFLDKTPFMENGNLIGTEITIDNKSLLTIFYQSSSNHDFVQKVQDEYIKKIYNCLHQKMNCYNDEELLQNLQEYYKYFKKKNDLIAKGIKHSDIDVYLLPPKSQDVIDNTTLNTIMSQICILDPRLLEIKNSWVYGKIHYKIREMRNHEYKTFLEKLNYLIHLKSLFPEYKISFTETIKLNESPKVMFEINKSIDWHIQYIISTLATR